MKIINPMKKVNGSPHVAVAHTLSNDSPSVCPKCGQRMIDALLYNNAVVYYCDACRVSQPKETNNG